MPALSHNFWNSWLNPQATSNSTTAMTTFGFLQPPPLPHLSFSPSAPPTPTPTPQSRKRPRPLNDVEGLDYDTRDYSKKRRLRLTLITSRLSEPFAIPPTNILNRGSCSRVALWARNRGAVAPRNGLRKAAIMNKIKRDALAARAAKERQVEAARREYRQRIAAAAQLSSRQNYVVPLIHQPLTDETAYVVKAGKMKDNIPPQSKQLPLPSFSKNIFQFELLTASSQQILITSQITNVLQHRRANPSWNGNGEALEWAWEFSNNFTAKDWPSVTSDDLPISLLNRLKRFRKDRGNQRCRGV
ncbi:hypothetical protein RUND412_005940 [Rhizina undulata]